jgi:hypothetical protein
MYSVKAKAASVLGGKSSVVSTVSGPGMQGGGMNGGKIGFPSRVMRRGGDKNMTKENASMESQESQSVMIRDWFVDRLRASVFWVLYGMYKRMEGLLDRYDISGLLSSA